MQTNNNSNQKNKYPVDAETAKRAKAAGQEDNIDNPIIDEEAQNITDGPRMSDNEAKQAIRKANEGKN